MRLFQEMRRAAVTRRRQRHSRRPTFEVFEDRTLLANIIPFDLTGGAGVNPANVVSATSFTWLPGTALSVGGGALAVGKDVPLLYEAILQGIQTAGIGGADVTANGNNGNLSINGTPTNVQIVITAQFTEKVQSISPDGKTATFVPDLGVGANVVKIYAQAATDANSANLNDSSGKGFGPGNPVPANSHLILTGHVTLDGFSSSYTASAAAPQPLNQHVGGSGSYAGVNTIVGSGVTGLQVAVDTYDTHYFLTGAQSLVSLTFAQVSAATPFQGSDPQTRMFDGTVPKVGAVNGVSGPDFLFESQATNNFTLGQQPPPTGNLARTWGYWKTHDGYGPQANAWPTGTFDLGDGVEYFGAVDAQGRAASSMEIGGHFYSFSDLQTILGTSVGGDGVINLGHQLIGAILNVANGAGTTAARNLIHQASDLLATNHLVIGVNQVTSTSNPTLYAQLIALEVQLEAFNKSGI
jgi:hypothetical protein